MLMAVDSATRTYTNSSTSLAGTVVENPDARLGVKGWVATRFLMTMVSPSVAKRERLDGSPQDPLMEALVVLLDAGSEQRIVPFRHQSIEVGPVLIAEHSHDPRKELLLLGIHMLPGAGNILVRELAEQCTRQFDIVGHIMKRSGKAVGQSRQVFVFLREISNHAFGCRIPLQQPPEQRLLTGMMNEVRVMQGVLQDLLHQIEVG